VEPDILIHNRKSNKPETEHVYGEKWLDFAYNNPLGKAFLWTIVKRPWFSKWYGE
jgi:phosphatidylserine decarboxylase